jgi:hypothetical protein
VPLFVHSEASWHVLEGAPLFTNPAYRRVAAGSALVVAVFGLPALWAPAADAVAPALGSCAASSDVPTKTIALTADCDTFSTLDVPDGWTLDGAGHTITAVQDATHPSFVGGVISSATGDDTAAATMNVKNLAITTRDFDQFTQDVGSDTLYGIKMVRAGGTITDVSVNGIAHTSGGQSSRAVFVSNEDNGSRDVPRAEVSLNRVTITRYQKSGLFLRGNLAYDVRNLDVGPSTAVDGTPNTTNAANGVTAINGAHGSLTDSNLGQNRYATDDGGEAADVTTATSVLLYNAGRTTLSRNVFEGTDGDVGVELYNDSNSINTIASMTCSTLVRDAGGNADSNAGFGVWNYEGNAPSSVDLTVGSNTFRGWAENVQGASTSSSDPGCTTGNTLSASTSQVVYGAKANLVGNVRNQDGSAATGTATLQRRENGTPGWSVAGTSPTNASGRYTFQVTPDLRTQYRTVFAGDTYTGSTSKAVTVRVAPKVAARANRQQVRRHNAVTVSGTVAPKLPGSTVVLQRKSNGRWVTLKTGTVSAASAYQLTWQPLSAGQRYLRVLTRATTDYAAGTSGVVKVRVLR